MLNTTADLKSTGQPENTDTATSTSLQNKDRAPSHLAGLEVKNTESQSAQRAFLMTKLIILKSSEREREARPPCLQLMYSAASERGKQA